MRVICPWKHTALQKVLVPLKPSFTDPWQNFCGNFLFLTGNTVIMLKMATFWKHSSNAQCCSGSCEGQHKLVLFLEMFHLTTAVGTRLSVCFSALCHCGKRTRESRAHGESNTWACKKKREIWNLSIMKNLNWNHSMLVYLIKPTNSGCQKEELTTLVLVRKLLLKSWQKQTHVALENKRGSCLLTITETK